MKLIKFYKILFIFLLIFIINARKVKNNKVIKKNKRKRHLKSRNLKLNIIPKENTLDELIYNNKSIVRFGDGEYDLIFGRKISFQEYDEKLSERLNEILKTDEKGLLIGIHDSLNEDFINKYFTESAKTFWKNWIKNNEKKLIHLLDENKTYYSSQISRFYMDYKDKSNVSLYVNKLKKLWDKKDIVIIEGDKSRLGVGNDLFNNTNTIQRILCPSVNAFEIYDKIYNESLKIPKNKLVLIALGPTATVLGYDLYKKGYQAIDIGHIDIEYEWYLRNSTYKVKIENKYTNEAIEGSINIKDIDDANYNKQIIAKIINEEN